jgi:predicted RNA-binding protein with PIN domain
MRWLIDGHNLIGQMPGLQLDDYDDEAKLLEHLRRHRARTGHTVTVVFDPGPGHHSSKTKKQGGLTIQFAPSGKTADQVIIERIRQLKNPQETVVVTSDRAVARMAQQYHVRVIDSRTFARQLLQPGTSSLTPDQGSHADIKLSPEEVEDWLRLFNRRNHKQR